MSIFVRATGSVALLLLMFGATSAATPKEIDAAIKKGTDSLKARYGRGAGGFQGLGGDANYGIGPTCLAGLAILEGGVPVTDPAVKAITESIRNAAYSQVKTYQISLCLMYLDRLGDPADVPLIQILAVRLLVGQTGNGGWAYECIGGVNQADEARLRTIKTVNQMVAGGGAAPPVPKLNPEVEKYAQAIAAARAQGGATGGGIDDNSNTQFAVIAVWLSRKHGVPVDGALDLIEKRFLGTQSARTGGWPYAGGGPGGMMMEGMGSPAMYCAGLIGLATGVARREERRMKTEPVKKDEPKTDPKSDPKKNPDDPFFMPPPKGGADPKKPVARPLDARDRAVQFGFAGLGTHIAESAQAGRGALVIKGDRHGYHDLYFLWSVERACVIFGIEKLGGVDWYEAGAHSLVATQGGDGSWGMGGGYGAEVNTAFAVLFLCRSNLARDLSSKVQKETATEMRAGAGPGATETKLPGPTTSVNPNPVIPAPIIPGATGSEAATLAAELVRTADKDWATVLGKLHDGKGAVYTQALVVATSRLEGTRLKSVREALADRLTRMTAETLRTMAKAEDAELRRGAVLAMAMKNDKAHLPDLIAALLDDEELVVRAAKAGLKSITGEDLGPPANASTGDKIIAADAWKSWLGKQKK